MTEKARNRWMGLGTNGMHGIVRVSENGTPGECGLVGSALRRKNDRNKKTRSGLAGAVLRRFGQIAASLALIALLAFLIAALIRLF